MRWRVQTRSNCVVYKQITGGNVQKSQSSHPMLIPFRLPVLNAHTHNTPAMMQALWGSLNGGRSVLLDVLLLQL